MPDFDNRTCILTAIYVFRTNDAVKLKLDEEGKPFWIPFSQIPGVLRENGEDIDIIQVDPNETYLWRITGWIACKVFDCDGWDELVDLDLSFINTD